MVAENFVELNPLPGQGPGRAGLADVLGMMFAGFPDLRWTLHDTLVEGDRVMGFSTWTGTHEGEFMGIPATGRTATIEAWTIDRFRRRHLRREPHHHGRCRTARPARRPPGPLSRLTAPAERGVSRTKGGHLGAQVFEENPPSRDAARCRDSGAKEAVGSQFINHLTGSPRADTKVVARPRCRQAGEHPRSRHTPRTNVRTQGSSNGSTKVGGLVARHSGAH